MSCEFKPPQTTLRNGPVRRLTPTSAAQYVPGKHHDTSRPALHRAAPIRLLAHKIITDSCNEKSLNTIIT